MSDKYNIYVNAEQQKSLLVCLDGHVALPR